MENSKELNLISAKPRSLVGKAAWLLRHRPGAFVEYLIPYLGYQRVKLLFPLWNRRNQQVHLGKNVRLQRLRSLVAEKPSASIEIGDHSIVPMEANIQAYGQGTIRIGTCAVLGGLRIASRQEVSIGDRFICSWNVFIQDFDPHPPIPEMRARQVEAICASFRPSFTPPPFAEEYAWKFASKPVVIGDDVWVGANCTILKGAQIGHGCIVAAGTVVSGGTFPDRSLIAGNPARIVKTFD